MIEIDNINYVQKYKVQSYKFIKDLYNFKGNMKIKITIQLQSMFHFFKLNSK